MQRQRIREIVLNTAFIVLQEALDQGRFTELLIEDDNATDKNITQAENFATNIVSSMYYRWQKAEDTANKAESQPT